MIKQNLEMIRARIHAAALRAGRDPSEVRLVAVSKKKTRESILEAHDCGQDLFAENYFQDAREKIESLDSSLIWHFIGHLQSNKAAIAAQLFDMIETVDRLKIARILDKSLQGMNKILPVLIQVNIGRELQKSGINPEEAENFFAAMKDFPRLQVRGMMVIPPFGLEVESVRPYFRAAKDLLVRLVDQGLINTDERVELSMGMSADFEVAIEEGATLVRVGTALFGPRE